ncbi:MAG TPA: HD domain-containing phosphohydrolase [Bdellovibrionota bacterium]|nr:HD domain-containing phosphohydrolase [Bdellovibrionota bacterium]
MSEVGASGQHTRNRELIIALNQLGRGWLHALFAALRTIQFHDAQNQIFNDPIESLVRKGEEILALEGHADFRTVEDQFFLNGLWIKPALSEKENLFLLANHFKDAGLGGITVRAATTDHDWRSFLSAYRSVHGPVEERARLINQALTEARIEQVEVRKIVTLKHEVSEELPLPKLSYSAVTTYAKLLFVLREFAFSAPGEDQISTLRKTQRLVCDIVDLSEKIPRLFALLPLLKSFDSYFYHHCVNVMVYSLALGREIGIGRKELVELGMAALLHDVGKLQIPEEILSKPSALTEEEWRRIRNHPIDSAAVFLTLGYMNESVAERVLVSYQHHWVARGADVYPKPRRAILPSLMAELVGVSVMYDALSTDEIYRGSFTPFEAIRILAAESAQGRYRKDVVHAFLRVMGPLPVGSSVRLDDSREGIVACSGALSPTPPFPVIFVPNEQGGGEWIDAGVPLETTQRRVSLLPGRSDRNWYRQTMRHLFLNAEAALCS